MSVPSLRALRSHVLVVGVAAMLLTASPVFAEFHLTMHDGRVSLVAKDATVRQILTEWARVGGTKIINVEKIPGGPVTLVLENVTEMQALEVLLRPLSGYIAAPRAATATNLSAYDRIIIMPTLADARPAPMVAASASAAAPYSPPVFQQPPPVVQSAVQSTDDDPISEAPVAGSQSAAGGSGPTAAAIAAQAVAATSAQTVAPGAPVTIAGESTPTTYPRGLEVGRRVIDSRIRFQPTGPSAPPLPTGVAVPGMIAPGAPQPGQPGQPPGQPYAALAAPKHFPDLWRRALALRESQPSRAAPLQRNAYTVTPGHAPAEGARGPRAPSQSTAGPAPSAVRVTGATRTTACAS